MNHLMNARSIRSVALVAAMACLISSLPRHACASDVSMLLKNLPRYLARSRPLWPKDSDGDLNSATLLGERQAWGVSLPGTGVRSLDGDSANTTDFNKPCSEWPYRHFFSGKDTITFTYARIPEGCSESPGMTFRNSRGARERVDLTPLYNWNVDAVWFTRHFLVFGVTANYESALPQFVRIACWELETGRWFTSPTRDYLMHRPGFDLSSLLPDWPTARAHEIDGAIVLRGKKRGLALWPGKGVWSLIDAATGRPTSVGGHPVFRSVVKSPDQRIGPALREEIRRVFAKVHDKANREIVDFNIIDLIRGPCSRRRREYAVTARAVGRDRAPGRPEMDWTRELFGVCLLDSSLAHVTKSFAPFPSHSWADATAYFDLEAPGDSIIVWEEGATYSDFGGRFAYPCSP